MTPESRKLTTLLRLIPNIKITFDYRKSCNDQEEKDYIMNIVDNPRKLDTKPITTSNQRNYPNGSTNNIEEKIFRIIHFTYTRQNRCKGTDIWQETTDN